MTRLYLHIGTEKTGTSSVQQFLNNNRELLRRHGVLYPVAPGKKSQTLLTVAAQKDKKKTRARLRKRMGVQTLDDLQLLRNRLVEGLREEIVRGTYRTVVMSNEQCSYRLQKPGEVPRLH